MSSGLSNSNRNERTYPLLFFCLPGSVGPVASADEETNGDREAEAVEDATGEDQEEAPWSERPPILSEYSQHVVARLGSSRDHARQIVEKQPRLYATGVRKAAEIVSVQ